MLFLSYEFDVQESYDNNCCKINKKHFWNFKKFGISGGKKKRSDDGKRKIDEPDDSVCKIFDF